MSPSEQTNPLPPSHDQWNSSSDDAVIGRAFRWSMIVLGTAALIASGGGLVWWLNQPPAVAVTTEEQPTVLPRKFKLPPVTLPKIPFTDITEEAGITFVHENGAAGEKLLPETMGGGCAFFDYDQDGDPDLLFVNSRRWEWDERPAPETPATLELYQNRGDGTFQNVTAGSGLDISLYGMGVAIGDYNGDGQLDVYISAVGENRLFRNLGEGKFEDVTASAQVAGAADAWSTSCGFFDYDRDGDLDLFVCNYVVWSREVDLKINSQVTGADQRAYGQPTKFQGTHCTLFRNNGNETFEDVTRQAGIEVFDPSTGVAAGKSLGVTFTDIDSDGWLDIIVANDTVRNFLFLNQQDGTFRESAIEMGIAFDNDGNARGAMGIDAADFRNNGSLGIAIGNFANERTALYVQRASSSSFADEAISNGLGRITLLQLTFGIVWGDFDLDGRLDLVASNGHLEEEIHKVQESQQYEQSPQLLWNCGPGYETEFIELTAQQTGDEFQQPTVGRGVAVADIDGDGDLDVLLTAVGRPPRLLRNDQRLGHSWLRVSLPNQPIGAIVQVQWKDRILTRRVMPTRSYLSQSELPLTFGLGSSRQVEKLIVTWPDGETTSLEKPPLNQMLTIER